MDGLESRDLDSLITSNDTISQIFSDFNVVSYQVSWPGAKNEVLKKVFEVHLDGDPIDLRDTLLGLPFFNDAVLCDYYTTGSCSSPVLNNDPLNDDHLILLDAYCAWTVTEGSSEIIVGVVDTEFDTNHEDLENQILSVSGVNGSCEHGTGVSGCASAEVNNNTGIAGIGYNTKLKGYVVPVNGSCLGTPWPLIWEAYLDGVDIINVSWTGFGNGYTVLAIEEIIGNGIVISVAAGNSPNSTSHSAYADIPGVINVSGVDANNLHGPTGHARNQWVDVCAMSKNVMLTNVGSTYSTGNGTSLAAPQVAGLAALILSVNPCLTPAEVEAIIKSSADPISDQSNYPGLLGSGRANAYQALLLAVDDFGCEVHEPIQSATVWNTPRCVFGDLIIESGASLTITDEVTFSPNSKVIVHPNGELIIDGGHLKNFNYCGGTGFWRGIELWGTTGAPQAKVGGYRAQGYLQIKNGGVIENARNGVTNWKKDDWDAIGGVIDARDGEFRNCRRAVQFMKHQNVHPITGNPSSNLSKFKGTKFMVDNSYIGDFETDWPEAQVTLWGVDGVTFTGCEFISTSTVSESLQRSKGIYSSDAHYRVQSACATTPSAETGCPTEDVIPTVFDGFYRGIEAVMSEDPLPILVNGAVFRNNMVGVELASLAFSEIIKSRFEIGGHPHENDELLLGDYLEHLGVYSNETRCFAIEENEFIKDPNALWDERNGVLVYESEENSNNVYLNHFEDLESGAIGYQVNRNLSGFIGLQFNCNDMTDNYRDFVVARDQNADNSIQSGIRTFQGSYSPLIGAGNSFSVPNGVPTDYTHWDINSESGYFYYHSVSEDAPDIGEVTPNKLTPFVADNSHGCATNYSSGGHKPAGGKGGVIQEYNQKRSDYYNLLYTYKQMIDDGDTDGAIDEIIATWPQDAWDMYNMLIARSPNNSETVLIAAADREIMPHAMLLELLIVNPDALRNGNVIDHVENNLNNPMPGYMIDILHAASDQQTLRTTMESTLSNHHADMSRNYKYIIQFYTSDTLNGVHNDSLLHYLEQMDSPTGKYNLAGRLLRVGENTAALNIIDSIPHNYKLSDSQQDEWKAMQAFFNLLDDAYQDDRNIASLDSTELAQLESIALDADGGMGALRARKALCFFYQNCIPGPALPKSMSEGNKKPLPPLDELLSDLDKVSAFPNPAKDYLTFSYSFFREQAPNRQLRVFNQNGAVVQTFDLGKAQEGQQLWDTRKVTAGIYLYDVYEGKRKVHSGKIVIQ